MKQIAIVVIDTNGKAPYELAEKHSAGPYVALRHFFEDIDYKVEQLEVLNIEEGRERTAFGHLHVMLNAVRPHKSLRNKIRSILREVTV